MPRRTKCTQKAVEKALRGARGGVYLAAKRLGVSAQTVFNYLKCWPELREVVEEERGRLIDQAESKLGTAIHKGDGWAIQFALKTIGKDRGYTEKSEVNVTAREIDALIERLLAQLDPHEQAAPSGPPAPDGAGNPGGA